MVPAIRYNLFFFKEKKKRIFTSIGAKEKDLAFLGSFKK
ncbi:hypothetical protein FEM08_25960 [Flavobacterium gilvum]|nr:hypothetical protein FEM08_25960 [Flavobacterium gilvum]